MLSKMDLLFPNTLGRISFIIRDLLCTVILHVLTLNSDEFEGTDEDLLLILAALALILYWLVFVVRPRCKGLGFSGWCALVVCVPPLSASFSLMLIFTRSITPIDPGEEEEMIPEETWGSSALS